MISPVVSIVTRDLAIKIKRPNTARPMTTGMKRFGLEIIAITVNNAIAPRHKYTINMEKLVAADTSAASVVVCPVSGSTTASEPIALDIRKIPITAMIKTPMFTVHNFYFLI
jgi:hypothetical protein